LTRWLLQVDTTEFPEWNKTLMSLEQKCANDDREYGLVHDFDVYLHKHGYLTKRQVDVLKDIAKAKGIALPAIPDWNGGA
jgi:hypothetical protein